MSRHRHSRGFTLLELLVVIGILLVLVGLLVPVVGTLRKQAHATDTIAAINHIRAMIQAYHGDFRAYPGPIPNAQLRSDANKITIGFADDRPKPPQVYIHWNPAGITMAENLVLGLLGGLKRGGTDTFAFVYTRVGEGPRTLGVTPKKLPAYGNAAELAKLGMSGLVRPSRDEDLLHDSQVPEFVDRFPEPLPYLYLRARTGAAGVVSVGPTTPAPGEQYDLTQVLPYTGPAKDDSFIGLEKENDGVTRVLPPEAKGNVLSHGFIAAPVPTATMDPASTGYTYPYNLYAVLRDPTIGKPGSPGAAVPRQKDGYIIISAGIDRIYGTKDDLTSFGSY